MTIPDVIDALSALIAVCADTGITHRPNFSAPPQMTIAQTRTGANDHRRYSRRHADLDGLAHMATADWSRQCIGSARHNQSLPLRTKHQSAKPKRSKRRRFIICHCGARGRLGRQLWRRNAIILVPPSPECELYATVNLGKSVMRLKDLDGMVTLHIIGTTLMGFGFDLAFDRYFTSSRSGS
ncbi:hypothetical protein [Breoghania sp. L-A4]|uniref:hypothetical protein n=1 Tax=Breoghania sp. L-A4 TaxID=2304600 RepID=UPI0013C2BB82|nr:hypothetical protein [Breoghania sp. L-A4]